MESKKGVTQLVYALYRASEEFKDALEEYDKAADIQPEMVNALTGDVSQLLSNYKLSIDGLTEFLPLKYRMLLNVAKQMRFDQVVDIAASVLKEYGRTNEGNYKSFGETVDGLLVKMFLKNLLTG